MAQQGYSDEAGMVKARIATIKKLGGRPEYSLKPGAEIPGRPPIFYLPTQLVATRRTANLVHRLLEEWHGECGKPEPLLEYDDELVVFTVKGDSLHLAAAIRQAAAKLGIEDEVPVAPLHVLFPAPQPKIGPGDDPTPAGKAGRLPQGPAVSSEAPVAVIDTGLWLDPPQPLNAALAAGAEERVDDDPSDGFVDFYGTGHGGFIAGVIENNAPGTKVIAHNAFGKNGLTEATVINQVDAALQDNDVIVLNLSLGSYEKDDGCDRVQLVALRAAMRRWRDKFPQALIVAAAGNDATSDPFFPAGFAGEAEFADMVVSVGALAPANEAPGIHTAAAGFSNFGPWVTAWAPGEKIISEYPDDLKFAYMDSAGNMASDATFSDGLASWSGASFAAPFVAAEIIREMRRGETPRDTWQRIRGASPFVIFWPSWSGPDAAPRRDMNIQ